MNLPINIPFSQLSGAGSHLWERFGAGKVLGCAGLGCLLPVSCGLLFLLVSAWGFVPMDMFASAPVEQRQPERGENYANYRQSTMPVQPVQERVRQSVRIPQVGELAQVDPTPVYAPTNAQGGVWREGVPSMMGNQPARSSVPMQDYQPYTGWQGWENSTASKSSYLARVNMTGARRTPYSQGQTLTYADGTRMTVVTGDFDFTLLEDSTGTQWACPLSVNTLQDLRGCSFWR